MNGLQFLIAFLNQNSNKNNVTMTIDENKTIVRDTNEQGEENMIR